eukprot:10191268-Alexandrium_andersonii.AAC.1
MHPAEALRCAAGPRIHQCATLKRAVRSALSIGALGGSASETPVARLQAAAERIGLTSEDAE